MSTKEFGWTNTENDVFNTLKERLTSAPVLGFPNATDIYVLDTDASHDCTGAVLSQIQSGREKVIAYASHRLTKAEKAYCVTRKELYAVYRYVLQFRHYLAGKRFIIRSDHQALQWILNLKSPNTSQFCTWKMELESYDFEIRARFEIRNDGENTIS